MSKVYTVAVVVGSLRKDSINRKVALALAELDRKSTRLNSSHGYISYAVFCLKKKKQKHKTQNTKHKNQRNQY
mgnify:CR=1 FL=1